MEELATLLKHMNLFAHNSHNLSRGPLFLQDHAFLSDLYEAYDGHYDSVVERIIGLGQPCNLKQIAVLAASHLEEVGDNKAALSHLYKMENELCSHIEELAKSGVSQGTLNLLADLADKSEQRQYLLSRRIK